MNRFIFYCIGLVFFTSCNSSRKKENVEVWKNEILQTEADFEKMVREEGIPKAFLFYADENAVLMRNDKLIEGKQEIARMYQNRQKSDSVSLTWKPDFVEVSASGDLAYTYGVYEFSKIDSTGTRNVSTGIFHTVWKKQADGSWKYVWD